MRLFLRNMRGKVALCWFTFIVFYVLSLGSGGPVPPDQGLIAALFHLTLILVLVSPELLYLIKSPGRNWLRWGPQGDASTARSPKKFEGGAVMASYSPKFRVATFFTQGRKRCTTTLRDCTCREFREDCTTPCTHMCQLAIKLGATRPGKKVKATQGDTESLNPVAEEE